jgi:hypothetical protein
MQQRKKIKNLTSQAKNGIESLNTDLSKTLKPQIEQASASLDSISDAIESNDMAKVKKISPVTRKN